MTAPVHVDPSWLAAILPGLRRLASPQSATVPPEFLAATVTTPANPVPSGAPLPAAGAQAYRLTLPDLIPSVTMTGGALAVPTFNFTHNAGPHAEGASKAETVTLFGGGVQKAASVATFLNVSDELLSDVAGLESWLRAFLGLAVRTAEEKEILGNGSTSNIKGVYTPGLAQVYAGGGATAADVLAGMLAQAAKSGIAPDTAVVTAADWASLFASTRGTPLDSASAGLTIVTSPALAAGQMVVGPFQSLAVIGREGGVIVSATDSHQGNFVLDIATIRAQSRLAFGMLFPDAFVVKPAT